MKGLRPASSTWAPGSGLNSRYRDSRFQLWRERWVLQVQERCNLYDVTGFTQKWPSIPRKRDGSGRKVLISGSLRYVTLISPIAIGSRVELWGRPQSSTDPNRATQTSSSTHGATLHGHERGLLWRQQRPSVSSRREGRSVIPASGRCRLALYSVVSLPQATLA